MSEFKKALEAQEAYDQKAWWKRLLSRDPLTKYREEEAERESHEQWRILLSKETPVYEREFSWKDYTTYGNSTGPRLQRIALLLLGLVLSVLAIFSGTFIFILVIFPPIVFFSVAEDAGLIERVSNWSGWDSDLWILYLGIPAYLFVMMKIFNR